ncbi:unnamed protein product [Caenorhabditis angaria]|uniref:DUF4440 domain-containing protein n=1 Tax=Caenorhabditis angaria TaxID=860376 RepID=A0A9P1IQY5_9PELO|nr:unnamed protein product [Caenorhabditis angaria]
MSKAEFQKLHDEMKALKNAAKHDEFAKRFAAKDSVFIGPFHEPHKAEEALALAKSGKVDALVKADIESTVDEVVQIGDVVIDRSSLVVKLPGGDKNGWNLTVWVKEDGQWKIRNTCTTFKLPLPA